MRAESRFDVGAITAMTTLSSLKATLKRTRTFFVLKREATSSAQQYINFLGESKTLWTLCFGTDTVAKLE